MSSTLSFFLILIMCGVGSTAITIFFSSFKIAKRIGWHWTLALISSLIASISGLYYWWSVVQ